MNFEDKFEKYMEEEKGSSKSTLSAYISDIREFTEFLKERGKENNAVVISNVGLEGEYVGPLDPDREYGYFTTMVIKNEM